MKRIILMSTIILVLALYACDGGKTSGTTSTTSEPAQSPTSEPTQGQDGRGDIINDEPITLDDLEFNGAWVSFADNSEVDVIYGLFNDGTFIRGFSEARELYADGKWSIADGELKLEVGARWILPAGNIEDVIPEENMVIADGEVIKTLYNPPEIETYDIILTGIDPETNRVTITIDGAVFYDFYEQDYLFDRYYELVNNDGRGDLIGSDPSDTDVPNWWGEFKGEEFSVGITNFDGTSFWFTFYNPSNGQSFFDGVAALYPDNEYMAEHGEISFYLYEDFNAVDFFTSENSEWVHLRGHYVRTD